MDFQEHCRGIVITEHGIIAARRVDHHPGEETDDDVGACGVCFDPIWTNPRMRHFIAMTPQVPIVCCRCGTATLRALHDNFPHVQVLRREVPDLAKLGTFN
jgi:hypothetical protein